MNSELTEKIKKINRQYQPIEAMINSIPDDSVNVDGIEYAKAATMINRGLLLVIHHCKNMKLINADFDAPFTKQELERLTSKPFNRAKLNEVEELRVKYAQLDEEAYQKGAEVA